MLDCLFFHVKHSRFNLFIMCDPEFCIFFSRTHFGSRHWSPTIGSTKYDILNRLSWISKEETNVHRAILSVTWWLLVNCQCLNYFGYFRCLMRIHLFRYWIRFIQMERIHDFSDTTQTYSYTCTNNKPMLRSGVANAIHLHLVPQSPIRRHTVPIIPKPIRKTWHGCTLSGTPPKKIRARCVPSFQWVDSKFTWKQMTKTNDYDKNNSLQQIRYTYLVRNIKKHIFCNNHEPHRGVVVLLRNDAVSCFFLW